MITTPRCLHPVAYRAKNDPGTGLPAVCWRPAGHPSTKHRSRKTIERELSIRRAMKRERRSRQELAA